MKNPLVRLPWFVVAPAFVVAVVLGGFVTNYLGADYFKRTRLDEANPLAGVPLNGGSQAGTRIVASGMFRDGDSAHRGRGTVRLIAGTDGAPGTLRIEDFSVTNGPDLFVVLSTADGYTEQGALNLGGLKATDGDFNYEIPAGTDLSRFTSVVVWCRQFDVDFAIATLMPEEGAAPMASDSPAREGPSPSPAAATPPVTASPPAAPHQASTRTPAPNGPVVLATGEFRDGAPGHRGSGKVALGRDAEGKLVLVLEDFSVTNGPDLHVILSRSDDGGNEGLDLGELKATDGTFSYAVPEGTDLSQYRSVTIFCVAFPTIFAYAPLEN